MASETAAAGPEPVSASAEPAAGASGVWEVYFGQPSTPEGGVHWEAYSHDELYQMLWQDADVADVSTIAAEWSEHRAALANHAEVLREQRAALLQSWQGTGAEAAARRLAVLADRVETIAELAYAGGHAAEQAADALAWARAMMPEPANPAAQTTDAATNWADLAAAPQDWSSTQTTAPSSSTADPASAFGAVNSAGFSFFAGANATDLQKQQAIRAMQTYESSLAESSRLVGQAQSTIPEAATAPSSATEAAGAASGRTPSWQSLVGSGPSSGTARPLAAGGALSGGPVVATGMGKVAGMRAGNPLAQGMRVGAAEMSGAPGAAARAAAAESAAARSSAPGAMVPPGGGSRGGSGGGQHENQMPTIDRKLFPLEEPGSEVVIGLSAEEYR